MSRKMTIPRLKRAFKLYKRLSIKQRVCVVGRTDGKNGIDTALDRYALSWQSLGYRMAKIDQWITEEPIDNKYYKSLWEYQKHQRKEGKYHD